MAPNDVSSVAYLSTTSVERAGLEKAVAFTCAECVRAGARNIRVYRTKTGMDDHLRSYHKSA